MPSVYEYAKEELAELLVDEPRYRVDQVWHGLWTEGQALEGITTIPKTLRSRLAERFPPSLEVADDVASEIAKMVSDPQKSLQVLGGYKGPKGPVRHFTPYVAGPAAAITADELGLQ